MARKKLETLLPKPGESVDAYIARGEIREPDFPLEFRPQEGDSLGEYLVRLRAANGLSPERVEELLGNFPSDAAVTRAELARLESSSFEFVNEQRLRVLASLYRVPQIWVLQVAQYHVERYTSPLPPTDNTFAMLTARALHMNAVDPEAQQTLQEIFNEIIAAVQDSGSDALPEH